MECVDNSWFDFGHGPDHDRIPVSVCLPRSSVVSKRLKKYRHVFFSPQQPHHSGFFDPKRRYPVVSGTPSAGSLNTRGCEKNCDLRLKALFI